MPTVYIIAGPNGAGKTTFARKFLPYFADCKNFVNADLIAQGMSPFAPELVAMRAGRLMLEEIDLLKKRGADFGFETTLSGQGHLKVIRQLRDHGYAVSLFYLWVPTADVAVSRVRERVIEGGHDVPEVDVRRRFESSVRNFLVHYRQAVDSWFLFDNSPEPPEAIALNDQSGLVIIKPEIYNNIVAAYGRV